MSCGAYQVKMITGKSGFWGLEKVFFIKMIWGFVNGVAGFDGVVQPPATGGGGIGEYIFAAEP